MLHFDFRNLMADAVGPDHGLTPADLDGLGDILPAAHERFQEWRSSKDAIFYDTVFDDRWRDGISDAAEGIADRFDALVVLGIGGSALGLRCAAQALLPPFWNLLANGERSGRPRLFVCDNIDPETFSGLMDLVDLSATCFVVISKSGRTTETAAQLFLVLDALQRSLGDRWRDHLVVITDPASGELRPFVDREQLRSFPLEPKLGGRFSVLSPVGLFPAACLGIDIAGLVEGARTMARRCADGDLETNPAYAIGGYHHWLNTRKGKRISVMLPYADALALFSDWYAQLWAESLGKQGKGQTPVKALGATDQHSQIQLYMEGPPDKVITFVGVEDFRVAQRSTRIERVEGAFDFLRGHDLGAILQAEQAATSQALAKAARPCLTVTLPMVNAHHLGELFMVYEIATAFAGALAGINPFDQPGVEMGKVLTRERLSQISDARREG